MKLIRKSGLSLLLCVAMVFSLLPVTALADSVTDPADFVVDTGTGTITRYTGSGGDITIPSAIGGVTVTSINHDAFSGNTAITSVDIPASVISIGDKAFKDCSSLVSVHFSDAAQLKTIGKESFRATGLTSIALPSSVEFMSDFAFTRCPHLTTASLSSGADSIGVAGFSSCTALTTAIIPNGVVAMDYTFHDCSALTDVTIPSSVQYISDPFGGADAVVIHTDAGSMAENFAKDNNIACISGVEDGGIYNTDRTICFSKGTASLTATLDGAPYASGTPVSAEGHHTLTVNFTPNFSRTFHFTIDSLATVAPTITGPVKLTLLEGYGAASAGVYTVTGTAPVTVTKTSGDSKITWNDAAKKLDIAPGLTPGIYPVTLKATSGTSPDAALTFTLTVTDPADFTYDINTETITGYKGPDGDIVIPTTIKDPTTGSDMTVTCIGHNAFDGHHITNVAFLPDCKVTSISPYAFTNTYITKIDIPNSVMRIGTCAFVNDTDDVLQIANIPDSVKYIEPNSLGYNSRAVINTTAASSAVENFAKESNIPCLSGVEDGGVYNTGKALTIGQMKDYSISATLDGAPYTSGTPVTAEGAHTFVLTKNYDQDKMVLRTYHFTIDKSIPTVSITGPKTVTLSQGYDAASSDAYTITGTAPVTVTKTSGDSKITWNDATKKLDIAGGLSLGDYPVTLEVSDGTAAKTTLNITVTVNETYTNPSQYQFDPYTGTITGFQSSGGLLTACPVFSIPSSLYDSLTGEYVPVLHINNCPCSSDAGNTEFTIPSTVTRIGDKAFDLSYFSKLNFPADSRLKSIGSHAFDNGYLVNIDIPKSVVYIGNSAFANNNFLSNISIPSSVVHIGTAAFSNDPSVIIHTTAGSVAEAYANSNKIPCISGVEDGGIYGDDRTINFNEGTATLDGAAYTSGMPVGADGMHTLTVQFTQDVSLTLHFTIDKNSPVAPTITGPTSLQLTKGYRAAATCKFFIAGSAPVTVAKTSGDDKITWNDATKRLDIGTGLDVGSYPVTLTASNGTFPDATLTFTLTVESQSVAPAIHGPAGLTLTEGYLLPSTDEFTVTGTGPLWVQKYPGNTTGPESAYDHIDWSFFAGKLVVTPGIPAGSYPLKMTAINDKPQYGSLDFTLTVSPASAAHGITIETDGHGIAGSNEPSAVANTEIALTAIPYRGYLFKEWQVVGGGAAISGNRFAMPDNAVTLKAVFEKNPAATYTLTVNGSSASGFGSGSYAAGETAAIKAGSRSNYTFIGWSSADGVTFADPTSPTTTFTMPAKNVTVTADWRYNGGGGDADGGAPSAPATQNYTADVSVTDASGNNTKEAALPITVDTDKGTAVLNTGAQSNPISNGGISVITVPSIPDVNTYTLDIPIPYLSTAARQGDLKINTDKGSITVPSNMLTGGSKADGTKAEISISQGDKSALPANVQAAIGDRPLIQLSMTIDGKQTEWNNPSAPVTVSIPYKPTAAELANPESIVIWYIDGSGRAVSVPNGHYDAATGTVTFETTHFSLYTITYNPVSFNDVASGAWYDHAVSFAAARGITNGTDSSHFSPDAALTRGQFLVMLLRAYGVAADGNPTGNFADAGNTYYTGYLAAAKRLGITNGVGNNLFAPEKGITRQEMFTLLYNALNTLNQLPVGTSHKTLSDFTDSGDVSSWAKDSMAVLVETGIIAGNEGRLSPTATTTRAELAQVLYSLMTK